MSSIRRRDSSRANGARSHGPVTPEGKARSSLNAMRHGLLSKTIVIGTELTDNFDILVHEHVKRFGLLDGVEFGMVEEMAACYWRMRRIWVIEKEWLEQGIAAQDPQDDEATKLANSFGALADSNKYKVLHRYENRMHRIYQRSLKTLLILQEKNEQSDLDPLPDITDAQPEPQPEPAPAAEPSGSGKVTSISQPVRAPEPRNDETNPIPSSNTIQGKPEPQPEPACEPVAYPPQPAAVKSASRRISHCKQKMTKRTQSHFRTLSGGPLRRPLVYHRSTAQR